VNNYQRCNAIYHTVEVCENEEYYFLSRVCLVLEGAPVDID